MTQKGEHTWDLIFQYHRCDKCGWIIESREDYQYRMGEYVKDLECPRCHHFFQLSKIFPKRIGPIFGDPTRPEFDWR